MKLHPQQAFTPDSRLLQLYPHHSYTLPAVLVQLAAVDLQKYIS
ncbi:MAG: hypothetical protein PT120_12905 [Aphanizomenon gracile PMC649.10]|nr:hypothetical protein [Aphanizomenon gracile PMC638.10]MDM3849423.1 hypothetical protein [Aphanizomenon gracile PMC627.10]MDM3855765.1 hypothetical protein [Aphanizomenon gracile PMC649.10]MDM3860290.1 hypothetical protein [Aphanizomenon gracile PMC644.10]